MDQLERDGAHVRFLESDAWVGQSPRWRIMSADGRFIRCFQGVLPSR